MDPEAGTDMFRTAEDGTCRCLVRVFGLFGCLGWDRSGWNLPGGPLAPLSCLSFETGRDRSGRNLPPSALESIRFLLLLPCDPWVQVSCLGPLRQEPTQGRHEGRGSKDSEKKGTVRGTRHEQGLKRKVPTSSPMSSEPPQGGRPTRIIGASSFWPSASSRSPTNEVPSPPLYSWPRPTTCPTAARPQSCL